MARRVLARRPHLLPRDLRKLTLSEISLILELSPQFGDGDDRATAQEVAALTSPEAVENRQRRKALPAVVRLAQAKEWRDG